MSAKGTKKGVGPNLIFLIFCVGLVIACPVRMYIQIKNIDPSTGFYINSNYPLVELLSVVLIAASLFILIFSYCSSDIFSAVELKGRQIPLSVLSLFASITLVYDSIIELTGRDQRMAALVRSERSFETVEKLQGVFSFLAACWFIILFIGFLFGSNFFKKIKIFSLFPPCWVILSMLGKLLIAINYRKVSDMALELIAMIFMLLFLLSSARQFTDTNREGNFWLSVGSGIVASLLIFTYDIPRISLSLMGKTNLLVQGFPIRYSHLAIAFFAIGFIITALRKGSEADPDKIEKPAVPVKIEKAETAEETKTEQKQSAPVSDENGNFSVSANKNKPENKN